MTVLWGCGGSPAGEATTDGEVHGILLSPAAATLAALDQMQLTAEIAGAPGDAIAWSVDEAPEGGSVTQDGVYTAPAKAGTYHVVAKSARANSVRGRTTVTVTDPPPPTTTPTVVTSPTSATLVAGGTVQLTATVTNAANTAVTWAVSEAGGGTVTASGVYTAPRTAGTYHAVATSQADPTVSAVSTLTVNPAPAPTPTPTPTPTAPPTATPTPTPTPTPAPVVSVAVSPANVSVLTGGSTQLGATVSGTTNTSVSWVVREGAAGGAVSSAGLYTAPSAAGTYHVDARSQVDATKVGTSTITVTAPAPAPSTPTTNPWPTTGTTHLYVSTTGSDTASCTSAQPCRTIGRASSLATAGTVVHVAPGTYGAVSTSKSGTSTAPITYVSDTKWGAKISAPGQTNAWSNSGAWVVIQGFEITGSNYSGIMSTASHGRFRGNHIHHMAPPDCSRGGAGIELQNYSETDNDSDGNVIHDINGGAGCGLIHGIYYQGPYGGRIINNIVYKTSGWGIHLYHNANHILIANNTVFQNGHAGIIVGASYEGNDQLPGIDSGTTVINNIMVGNGGGCVEENNSGRTYGNTYVDNTCYANGGSNTISTLAPPSGQARSTVTGTLTSDPRFVNYQPDGSGDYRLQSGSPSANSGTATDAPGYDIGLVARAQGSAVDRGAYESW